MDTWTRFWPLYLFIVATFFVLWMQDASPHSSPWGMKYPSDCCSSDGLECEPVHHSTIMETPYGYRIILAPGQHKNVKTQLAKKVFDYNSKNVKNSSDGHYHACVGSEYFNILEQQYKAANVWCIIVPPSSF